MSIVIQKEKINKFKSGETNVLVATQVIEEGLDVISCNVVLSYNMIFNIKSFIQMKGRARLPNSEFIILAHTSEKLAFEEKINELAETADTMKIIGTLLDPITPNPQMQKLYRLNPDEYIENKETKAKVCKSSATEYLELYCLSQRSEDKYINPLPVYDIMVFEGGKEFFGGLIMPKICKEEEIYSKNPITNKKDVKKCLAFDMIQNLIRKGKIDKYMFPITRNSLLKAKKEKIMKYIEANQKFNALMRQNKKIVFSNLPKPNENSFLFKSKPFGETQCMYLHPLEFIPMITAENDPNGLGILHIDPIQVTQFKISTQFYAENFEYHNFDNVNHQLITVQVNKPYILKLSFKDYQRLRFFYILMLLFNKECILSTS